MCLRAIVVAVALFVLPAAAAAASCPATSANDEPACDARPSRTSIARCLGDAHSSEACADRASGAVHASYLVRAASELTKAGIATGARTAPARRWLAHAMVLDERVQDDPTAAPALRRASAPEAQARDGRCHGRA